MTFCRAWNRRSSTWASLGQTFGLAIAGGWYWCPCEHLACVNERDSCNIRFVNIRQRIRYRTWQPVEMMNWEECWESTEWTNQSIAGDCSLIDAFINDAWHKLRVTIRSVHFVYGNSDEVSIRIGISGFLLILVEAFLTFVLGFQVIGLSQFSQRSMSPADDKLREKTCLIEDIYFSSAAANDPKCRMDDSPFEVSEFIVRWWCKCVSLVARE
jgi:hypothetical protein